MSALEEISYGRWVTCCPGQPIPGMEDVISEVRRSKDMRAYLRSLGY